MRIATNKELPVILNQISKDKLQNVYLYIDVLVYGVDDANIDIWFELFDDGIVILLRYYDSFQVFKSTSAALPENISAVIEKYKPKMISARLDVAKELSLYLDANYQLTSGYVLKYDGATEQDIKQSEVSYASKSDFEEIAKLICSDDEIGAHYSVDVLQEQLISRMESKTGRNVVIKDKSKLVAHFATYAEVSGLAVLGGLIILPEYRGKGYARLLMSYLSEILIKEKREVILFCNNEHILKMWIKLGASIYNNYGKLTLNNNI